MDQRNGALARMIDGPAAALADALAEREQALDRLIADKGAPLVEALRERTDAIVVRTVESAKALRAALDVGAAASADTVAQAHERVRRDVAGFLTRIENANDGL